MTFECQYLILKNSFDSMCSSNNSKFQKGVEYLPHPSTVFSPPAAVLGALRPLEYMI